MINAHESVKIFMYMKKIMFGFLPYVSVKMENIQQALWMIKLLFLMKL